MYKTIERRENKINTIYHFSRFLANIFFYSKNIFLKRYLLILFSNYVATCFSRTYNIQILFKKMLQYLSRQENCLFYFNR